MITSPQVEGKQAGTVDDEHECVEGIYCMYTIR